MRRVTEHPVGPILVLLPSCVMKVDGLDIGVGVEGVLVEEDCTTCVMGVEAFCEKFVVDVVRRFLQGDDMPPSCTLSVEGIFFSPDGVQRSSCRC